MVRAVALPILCLTIALAAQTSPFNGIPVLPPAGDGSYRMIISGHLHGSSRDMSGFPAATILANIDRVNESGASLFLSTGDLFMDPEKEIPQYRRVLFQRLKIPLFNAPGNHDGGIRYQQEFGPSHTSFAMGLDRIVLLDTEKNDGTLKGDQLRLLEELLEGDPPRNIFIVSHRPIWSEDDDRYGPLFEGNTRSVIGNNFKRDVLPLLERLAGRSRVHWFSGSMAGRAETSFFFAEHAANITFIQTAIRNEPWDALLIADVSAGGIRWSALPLTDRTPLSPQEYDVDWWQAQQGAKEPFNWRLLPYIIFMALRQPLFWAGVLVGALLLIIGRMLLHRVL